MSQNAKKIKRAFQIIQVLTKYGFEDLVARSGLKKWTSSADSLKAGIKEDLSCSVYDRIRLTLEDLGPTFVKFGQMFSSREDLLPKELVAELQKLQDRADVQEMNVREKLQTELNIDIDAVFSEVEEKPFASASISQIYKARLLNGEAVVLKVKRDHIQEIIEADLLIMQDMVKYLEEYKEEFKKINLSHILETFSVAINQELSFVNECNNIQQFSRNFSESELMYVPRVYKEFSSNNILCMELIEGIKVTDTDTLQQNGFDLVAIAQAGFNLYMEQVLEHGFFHADPHPGNIFVTYEGKIAFIDFGLMGTMMPKDKEDLEQFIVFLLQSDIPKLQKTIKRIAVKYNVGDEKKLEREIYMLMSRTESMALEDINIGEITNQMKSIFQQNEIVMPEHIYLLLKGIALIEGVGRTLYPELNIIEMMKPYGYNIIQRKLSLQNVITQGFKNAQNFTETISELPQDIREVLQKVKNNELKMIHEVSGIKEMTHTVKTSINLIVLAVIIAALSVGSAILVMANMPPKIYGVPVLGFIGFIISGILSASVIISIIRKK
jgi:ubiquinone biosynthesis protein